MARHGGTYHVSKNGGEPILKHRTQPRPDRGLKENQEQTGKEADTEKPVRKSSKKTT